MFLLKETEQVYWQRQQQQQQGAAGRANGRRALGALRFSVLVALDFMKQFSPQKVAHLSIRRKTVSTKLSDEPSGLFGCKEFGKAHCRAQLVTVTVFRPGSRSRQ